MVCDVKDHRIRLNEDVAVREAHSKHEAFLALVQACERLAPHP